MSTEVEKTGIFLRRDCTIVMTRDKQVMEIRMGWVQALDLAVALTETVRDLMMANVEKSEKEWTAWQHLN